MVSLLAKSNIHQREPVCYLEVRVPVNRVAAFGVQARHICVYLDFVHDVHVCLTCQSAGGNLVKREVFVFALGLVELGHRPVNAAKLQ